MQCTSEEKGKLSLCPDAERTIVNSIPFPTGDGEESEILGPYNAGIEGEMLCFNDILDAELQDPHGVLTLNEEFELDGDMALSLSPSNTTPTEVPESFGNLDSVGQSNIDFQSSSSINSCFDGGEANWSWEDIVPTGQLWDEIEDHTQCWLWEGGSEGESQRLEGTNHEEKRNALVAWLFS
uniref:Uncharacterized protein n=1 Tax=Rhizophora mucronata TaxID=61149 RepID=A0A2P2Q6T1_RHIMU